MYLRCFRQDQKRPAAYVLRRQGHVMYELQTADGTVHQHDRDRLENPWEPAFLDQVGELSTYLIQTSTHTHPSFPVMQETQPLRRSNCQCRPVCNYGIDEDYLRRKCDNVRCRCLCLLFVLLCSACAHRHWSEGL